MKIISIEQLAKAIDAKHQVGQQEAEKFVREFFKTVRNGLKDEKSLKIKGLGTFSAIVVKSQAEPERKFRMMTFAPDAKFAKSVNKPFEQFSVVTLAKDVSFDDVKEEIGDDSLLKSSAGVDITVDELPVADSWLLLDEQEVPVVQIASTPVVENPPVEETDSPSEKPVEEALSENHDDEKNTPDIQPLSDIDKEEPKKNRKWIWALAAAAAVCVLALFFLLRPGNGDTENANVQVAQTAPADTVQKANPAEQEQNPEKLFEKENQRVSMGAYRIVGVDTVITVTKGLTLQRIATIFLGSEMQDYLIAINDGNDNPQEGQRYKIPKLELKK